MSVRIIVDSGCDMIIPEDFGRNITVIPLKTRFGEEEYLDGVTITHREFFEKLIETDILPQTSQIAPYEYEEEFKKVKEAGDQAVCITISSKLSGCYQSACIAAEDYQGIIYVVDSENACIGERILTELAEQLCKEGKTASAIADTINSAKKKVRLIALLDTLEYLKKGGRISSAAAAVGSMLSIKPVIAIENGEVKMLGKARGSKNGNNLLAELVEKEKSIDYEKPFCLGYTGLSDDLLKKYVSDHSRLYEDHCSAEEIPVSSIGSAIGTHVGPGAIAVSFFVK